MAVSEGPDLTVLFYNAENTTTREANPLRSVLPSVLPTEDPSRGSENTQPPPIPSPTGDFQSLTTPLPPPFQPTTQILAQVLENSQDSRRDQDISTRDVQEALVYYIRTAGKLSENGGNITANRGDILAAVRNIADMINDNHVPEGVVLGPESEIIKHLSVMQALMEETATGDSTLDKIFQFVGRNRLSINDINSLVEAESGSPDAHLLEEISNIASGRLLASNSDFDPIVTPFIDPHVGHNLTLQQTFLSIAESLAARRLGNRIFGLSLRDNRIDFNEAEYALNYLTDLTHQTVNPERGDALKELTAVGQEVTDNFDAYAGRSGFTGLLNIKEFEDPQSLYSERALKAQDEGQLMKTLIEATEDFVGSIRSDNKINQAELSRYFGYLEERKARNDLSEGLEKLHKQAAKLLSNYATLFTQIASTVDNDGFFGIRGSGLGILSISDIEAYYGRTN